MGTGIYGDPNEYPAGLEFDYNVWSANTQLKLCNVPWDSEYRIVDTFDNQVTRDNYFDNLPSAEVKLYTNASYVRPSNNVRIQLPFSVALKYNYLRVINPAMPVTVDAPDANRAFFYFILDCRMIAPNTTELVLQLDIWQTYIYGVQFGSAFIERGHIGIANENNFDNFGRTYLTVPEGLDFGSDYRIQKTNSDLIINANQSVGEFDILAISINNLEADPGDVNNPSRYSARGSFFAGLPSGASFYLWSNLSDFTMFMTKFSEIPWVTQGIVSLTIIPKMTRYDPAFVYSRSDVYYGMEMTGYGLQMQHVHHLAPNWRESSEVAGWIPERYRHLRKFWTSPYMVLELTTLTGQPISIKPELWNSRDGEIIERFHPVPPTQRIVLTPNGYNSINMAEGDDFQLYDGEMLDFGTNISDFPQLAIVNDQSINYLASSKNARAATITNAEWSYDKANAATDLSYDQSTAATQLMNTLGANSLDTQERLLNNSSVYAGQRAALGLVGSIGSSGKAALKNAVGTIGDLAISQTQSRDQYNINAANQQKSLAANTQNQNYVRDSNADLQKWSAKGDYEQAWRNVEAQKRDALMIQPTTSGQMAGEAFNINFGVFGLFLRFKTIDEGAMRTIGDHWLRWGYAVNRYTNTLPANLRCMTIFTYWKMLDVTIVSSAVPEFAKSAIRGILEKGVTIYRNPADIGTVDIADNAPLEGITL